MSTKGVYRTMFFPMKMYEALKAKAKERLKKMAREGKVINRYGVSNYVRDLCEEAIRREDSYQALKAKAVKRLKKMAREGKRDDALRREDKKDETTE